MLENNSFRRNHLARIFGEPLGILPSRQLESPLREEPQHSRLATGSPRDLPIQIEQYRASMRGYSESKPAAGQLLGSQIRFSGSTIFGRLPKRNVDLNESDVRLRCILWIAGDRQLSPGGRKKSGKGVISDIWSGQ